MQILWQSREELSDSLYKFAQSSTFLIRNGRPNPLLGSPTLCKIADFSFRFTKTDMALALLSGRTSHFPRSNS